jgi:hypothetical protein
MHRGGPRRRAILPAGQNISGTKRAAKAEESPEIGMSCVFIEAFFWPAGFPPFCGRPVLPGSAYCPAHAALCAAPPMERRR